MRVLVAILLGVIIAAVAATALQALEWTFFDDNYATINVEGEAELFVVPDVATFNFSVEAEGADVAAAQTQSTETMNAIMAYLEEAGVEERDIKTTGYNAYPRYSYVDCTPFAPCERDRTLEAYVVSQNVTVKVRDTDQAGTLIGGVGERGADNLSGLRFEVDDMDALEEEARLAAIADAKEEAKRLAKELDVRLGDILNFSDGSGGYYPEPYMARTMEMADFAMEEAKIAPSIAVGENQVRATVVITYELK